MQIALFERPYSNKRFVYQILSSVTARCCAIHGSKVSGGAHGVHVVVVALTKRAAPTEPQLESRTTCLRNKAPRRRRCDTFTTYLPYYCDYA
jgi:hypothetical protein